MNWIKQNTFLAGLLAVVILGVAILGYLLMQARTEYTEAKSRLDAAYAAKADLERKAPFPNATNAAKLRQVVTDYRAKAEVFTNNMLQMQAPMPAGVKVARFQENLALNVDAVIKNAQITGVTLPEGFYLGMEKYRSQVPPEEAVDRLQFQLDATVRLTDLLMSNGVTQLGIRRESFETNAQDNPRAAARDRRGGGGGIQRDRDRRGGGRDAKAPAGEKAGPEVKEIYPMEVVFEIDPRGFRTVMNALSNTEQALGSQEALLPAEEGAGEYYFVTRWVRAENETNVGPERSDPDGGDSEDSNRIVDPDVDNEPFANAEAGGDELNMIFGTENIRAYLALDLVRFQKPKADPAVSVRGGE